MGADGDAMCGTSWRPPGFTPTGVTPPGGASSYCQLMIATGHFGDCATMSSYGFGVCAQFDRGYDWFSIMQQLDATVGVDHSAAVMVTAVSELCPWNESKTP